MSAMDCIRKQRAERSRTSAWPSSDWIAAFSRIGRLPRGVLPRARAMKASKVARAMPSATAPNDGGYTCSSGSLYSVPERAGGTVRRKQNASGTNRSVTQ
jgi:hypothetical protein